MSPQQGSAVVEVRGPVTPEELAAVLATLRAAVVSRARRAVPPPTFERWRRERIEALRHNR